MGIPVNDSTAPQTNDPQTTSMAFPDAPPSDQPSTSTSDAPPSDPSQLPPAALELATKLFNLAREGETATLAQYLTAGIPPNLTNHSGDTLLMLAAYHGRPETVRMLLQHNADPNVCNGRGQSPLAGAVFKGYGEVVKALYEEGHADKGAGQPNAVECARMFRRGDILRLFGEEVREGEDGGPRQGDSGEECPV